MLPDQISLRGGIHRFQTKFLFGWDPGVFVENIFSSIDPFIFLCIFIISPMGRIPLFLIDLFYLQCQCQHRRSLNKVCSCFLAHDSVTLSVIHSANPPPPQQQLPHTPPPPYQPHAATADAANNNSNSTLGIPSPNNNSPSPSPVGFGKTSPVGGGGVGMRGGSRERMITAPIPANVRE